MKSKLTPFTSRLYCVHIFSAHYSKEVKLGNCVKRNW